MTLLSAMSDSGQGCNKRRSSCDAYPFLKLAHERTNLPFAPLCFRRKADRVLALTVRNKKP